ncbi:hypothetical protein N657DRAFT_191406 [Parathielavia appendiculata]|uniref:Uncharacterized protein n=1 Tax=Parathielavia appendiculata TaxID=2587402 RepID=A0AAN6U6J6_9PEZI|nr:hypothetical protein N657DRAFT_191406 [Parathielavia appendiculata]
MRLDERLEQHKASVLPYLFCSVVRVMFMSSTMVFCSQMSQQCGFTSYSSRRKLECSLVCNQVPRLSS